MHRPSTESGSSAISSRVQFGDPGDVPVPADYNGDGITDQFSFAPEFRGLVEPRGVAV